MLRGQTILLRVFLPKATCYDSPEWIAIGRFVFEIVTFNKVIFASNPSEFITKEILYHNLF